MNKTKNKNSYIIIVVLALVLGFLAGIAGQMFSRYYLNNLAFFNDLYLPTQTQVGQRDVVIQEVNKVVVDQDTRIDQVVHEAKQAVYNVYLKKSLAKNFLDQIYLPSQRLANAVAVTSDGWLISSFPNVYKPSSLVVVQGSQVIPVTDLIYDHQTGLEFIKVEAENLQVLEFATREKITPGQLTILYDQLTTNLQTTVLQNIAFRSVISNNDFKEKVSDYDQRLLLTRELADDFVGAPLLNLNGQMVGLFLGKDQAIKINYVNFLLKSLLKDKIIELPYLGIEYVDLSKVDGYSQDLPTSGVVVTKISVDSPLAEDLAVSDVITEVEGIQVSPQNTFSDLILDFKMGNSVSLKVVRDGQQFEISYILAPAQQ